MYFCEAENFAYGEINEPSFSNPHPWAVYQLQGSGQPHDINPSSLHTGYTDAWLSIE